MAIQEQIQQDIKTAMRAGEKQKVEVLRMAMAALKNAQIDMVKQAYDSATAATDGEVSVDRSVTLSEEAAQATLAREVKRRRDAADAYRQAKRPDLAEIEEAEMTILESYLPKQLSPDELRPLVAAEITKLGGSTPADMGKVMPGVMQAFKGRADGRVLSQLVREILASS